jgi:hypothetical protein
MKRLQLAESLLPLLLAAVPASAAGDPRIEDLALCRDSWMDWERNDPSALDSFGNFLGVNLAHNTDDGSLMPNTPMTIIGMDVTQVFPSSLGMGLGFSVLIDAPFEVAKQALERDLGKPFADCQSGDGIRACELSIADQRTVVLVSDDASNDTATLIGCYYYYEK